MKKKNDNTFCDDDLPVLLKRTIIALLAKN